mmetsp:Transcript_13117/g.26609  ORF Transcript_13117/g.26609 Transcript_13117/m.26609 type:complete len:356 (-) Transcript_13117:267-1334(-)
MYRVLIPERRRAGTLMLHVGAPHQLGTELPALAPRSLEIEAKAWHAVGEVGLVRVEDHGRCVAGVVRALQPEHSVVDGGLEAAVLRVNHQPHTVLLSTHGNGVEPRQHSPERLHLIFAERRMVERPSYSAPPHKRGQRVQRQRLRPLHCIDVPVTLRVDLVEASVRRRHTAVLAASVEQHLTHLSSCGGRQEGGTPAAHELCAREPPIAIGVERGEEALQLEQCARRAREKLWLAERRDLDGGEALGCRVARGGDTRKKYAHVRIALCFALVLDDTRRVGCPIRSRGRRRWRPCGFGVCFAQVCFGRIVQDAANAAAVQPGEERSDLLWRLTSDKVCKYGVPQQAVGQRAAQQPA